MPPNLRAIYEGIDELDNIPSLFENAVKIAGRLPLKERVLNFLYVHSTCRSLSRAEWEKQVRIAVAIDRILRDFLSTLPIDSFNCLIDQAAKRDVAERLTSPKGYLILVFHGGFAPLLRKIFHALCKDGAMVGDAGPLSAERDAGSALFAAMRALSNGHNVYIAPDGPFGKLTTSMRVLGVDCPMRDGAAFLAFELGPNTAWLTLTRDDRAFIPVVQIGPSREKEETFPEYRDRLYRFYAAMIEKSLTGDPRSLALSGRWTHYLNSALSS
jgi:hypothetical protein